MKAMKYMAGLVALTALFASAQASATLINFEDAPAKSLADNDSVTNQYTTEGVTFSGAFLEATFDSGNPDVNPQGFLNDQTNNWDEAFSASPGLGDWFLRTGGEVGSRGGQGVYLTVDYTTPVFAASGQIWDIDGHGTQSSEQWRVVAFLNGVQVAFVDSPAGTSTGAGSLNGLPWTFNLASAGGFDRIEFVFTGSKSSGLGLAFDNFNTNSLTGVPEPAALGMFGLGALLIGLFAGLRRRVD